MPAVRFELYGAKEHIETLINLILLQKQVALQIQA